MSIGETNRQEGADKAEPGGAEPMKVSEGGLERECSRTDLEHEPKATAR